MGNENGTTYSEIKPIDWEVREQPLSSNVPVFGPLIAWIRNLVNSISTKWYLRSILQQQNELNHRLIEQAAQLQLQLSEQDREISVLISDLTEMTNQLTQMNKALAALETKTSADGSAESGREIG